MRGSEVRVLSPAPCLKGSSTLTQCTGPTVAAETGPARHRPPRQPKRADLRRLCSAGLLVLEDLLLLESFAEREPYARRIVLADQRGRRSQRCRNADSGGPLTVPTPVESEPSATQGGAVGARGPHRTVDRHMLAIDKAYSLQVSVPEHAHLVAPFGADEDAGIGRKYTHVIGARGVGAAHHHLLRRIQIGVAPLTR